MAKYKQFDGQHRLRACQVTLQQELTRINIALMNNEIAFIDLAIQRMAIDLLWPEEL